MVALDFCLTGLAAGRTLPEQLRTQRRKRSMSLRDAAAKTGLLPTTIAGLAYMIQRERRSIEAGADQPDFVQAEGVFFLAHILRRLSDEIIEGCVSWYANMGLDVPPRTASTLHLLYRRGAQSVTEMASALRQSHPLAIQWIRQLTALGLIETTKDDNDRRRTIVSLTAQGTTMAERLIGAHESFEAAYIQLVRDAGADPFDGLWRMENALRERSMAERLRLKL
jgi:DNA-binding MarR family transcriptional regulator